MNPYEFIECDDQPEDRSNAECYGIADAAVWWAMDHLPLFMILAAVVGFMYAAYSQ